MRSSPILHLVLLAVTAISGGSVGLAIGACGATQPASGGLGSNDGGAAENADATPDGATRHGVYLCCKEGLARSCCPPETLPDPSVGRSATCFQYGGVRGACVKEGGQLEAKDICATCCAGLKRVDSLAPADGGPIKIGETQCAQAGVPSVFGCAACGDGMCGVGENACNCPEDCK